jgi:hypothetical protein
MRWTWVFGALLFAAVAAHAEEPDETTGDDSAVVTEEEVDEAIEEATDDYLDDGGIGLDLTFRKGNVRGALQFFGDVGMRFDDPALPGRGDYFFFNGSLDIFFTAQVGDHFQILSETVFQNKVGSTPAGDGGGRFDQERLWAAWAFSEKIQIKFGLEHSPISFWNRNYHHGRWLELTVARPFLARFESGGGILPMHEAGLELLGLVPLGRGRLQYILFVSNGRGSQPTIVQEFSDANSDKAIVAGVGYEFDTESPTTLWGFIRTDEIPAATAPLANTAPIREWIGSLQFFMDGEKFDVLSEFAFISQDDGSTGQTWNSYTGYFQVGYHVDDDWTPYARIDIREMDQGTPYYFDTGRDLDAAELMIGARWNFLNNAALKCDLGFGRREERVGTVVSTNGYIRFAIQLAFVF